MIRFCVSLLLFSALLTNAAAQGLTPLAIFSGEPGTTHVRSLLSTADGQRLISVGLDAQGPILASLSVETSTGNLTFVDSERPEDCEFMTDVELASDGSIVFYTCDFSGTEAIGALRIDPDTGELSLINNRLIELDGTSGIRGMVISPDSQNLYVTGFIWDGQPGVPGNFVNAYELQPADGDLVEIQTIGDADLEGSVSEMFLSPDGRHLYARSRVGIAFFVDLLLFDRDSGGLLDNGRELPAAGSIADPVFTNNGSRLYSFGSRFGEPVSPRFISYMQRDVNNGELTQVQDDFDFSLSGTAVVSADAERLLYNNTGGIRAYRIDPSSGEYALVGEDLNAGFADIGASGFNSLVVSPDEQRLYAAFEDGIAMFGIEGLPFPPATVVPAFRPAGLLILTLLILAGAAVAHRRILLSR